MGAGQLCSNFYSNSDFGAVWVKKLLYFDVIPGRPIEAFVWGNLWREGCIGTCSGPSTALLFLLFLRLSLSARVTCRSTSSKNSKNSKVHGPIKWCSPGPWIRQLGSQGRCIPRGPIHEPGLSTCLPLTGSMLTTLHRFQAKQGSTFHRSAHWRGVPRCPGHGARAERAAFDVRVLR